MGRIGKKKNAIENAVDGTPVATAARVDAHEQTLMEDRAKRTSNDLMEFDETKHTPLSDAEMPSAADIMHRKLFEQTQFLCVIVQDMGSGDLQKKSRKRQQENLCLKAEMCDQIDEGLKKEESARQLAQNDSAAMKEDRRQIQLGSGSTVCSEARTAVGKGASGTVVRPPSAIAGRLNDFCSKKDGIQRMGH